MTMIHYMKLQEEPFDAISMGEKTIELRLYDEKRQQIQVGDKIIFSLMDDEYEITTYVTALHRADSFEELFKTVPLAECGFPEETDARTAAESMRKYYPAEREAEYGVIGIELSLRDLEKEVELERLVSFLKEKITEKMPIEEIVNVFEQMCETPVENTMLLFETGTFSFTGTPLFELALVRQVPNGEGEFYQIHVVVLYEPDAENAAFFKAVWDIRLKENIFDYIRNSDAFAYAKKSDYINVKIYMDET